jgi:hypothetical protein
MHLQALENKIVLLIMSRHITNADYQMYEYMLRILTPIIRAEAPSLTLIQG